MEEPKNGQSISKISEEIDQRRDIFFHFWDYVMGPTFAIVCPWFTVDSQESLDRLFALEFEM
jgi:hypothetical protein